MHGIQWTKEETDYLINNQDQSIWELVRALKRDQSSIRGKVSSLQRVGLMPQKLLNPKMLHPKGSLSLGELTRLEDLKKGIGKPQNPEYIKIVERAEEQVAVFMTKNKPSVMLPIKFKVFTEKCKYNNELGRYEVE